MNLIFNKYVATMFLFLFGNEILSLLTVSILAAFAVMDVLKARVE